MAGTHTDITERRRIEEALRGSLAEVKRHDVQMSALNWMNNLLLSCETREEAYAIISHSAGRLFVGCSGGLAMLGAEAAPELRSVATWGEPTPCRRRSRCATAGRYGAGNSMKSPIPPRAPNAGISPAGPHPLTFVYH